MRHDCSAHEELLVLRAQDGDQQALCAMVDHWNPRLSRHALRLTSDAEAAADVMQEVWLAIVRSLRQLDDPSRFRSWAYRIVTHKSADWIRRCARNRKSFGKLEEEPAIEDCRDGDRRDDIAKLRGAVKRLSPEQRTVLSMFYLDEMSVREIAEAFSLSVGTVKSRLFHARNRLRQVLGSGES